MEFEGAIGDASRDELKETLRDLWERTTKADALNAELASKNAELESKNKDLTTQLQVAEHITQALMKQITDITARLAQAPSRSTQMCPDPSLTPGRRSILPSNKPKSVCTVS